MTSWPVEGFAGAAKELRGLLGRAFCDNPGMMAVLGDDRARRLVRATRLMGGLTGAALAAGTVEVVRVEGRPVATSLSYGPGQKPRGLALLPIYLAGLSVASCLPRLLRLDEFLRTHHPRAPHFFLAVLGVEPDMQGLQLGSALLRALSARADAAGLPCYLETDREPAKRLYMRHGYEVVGEHDLANLGGVRFWRMQRPATRR
ncbi:GNAT family N-acetyltransferase [Nannocystis pusilla]|uniref:GNAT family N-acetyltransferase n=1 Tax=Nannocystis pusilla TaxID=889268 RepID=A0ABS7TTF5_9BACT|nr:GNAT family N-acetyltransferase [Nannocystis pusilla]